MPPSRKPGCWRCCAKFTREFLKEQDIQTLGAQITRLCVEEVGLHQSALAAGLIKPGEQLQELACAQMNGAPDDLAQYIQPQPDEVKTLLGVKTHLILKRTLPPRVEADPGLLPVDFG